MGKVASLLRAGWSAHGTAILTGTSISLGILFGLSMGKACVNATRNYESKMKDREEPMSKEEIIKDNWKFFIVPASLGAAAAGCCIGANVINHRKQVALMGLATGAETAYTSLKDKLPEMVGPRKGEKVMDAAKQDIASKNLPKCDTDIEQAKKGDVLIFDSFTGRWFRSDTDELLRAQNVINEFINANDYMVLNEYYEELGLEPCRIGEMMGWHISFEGNMHVGWIGGITPRIRPDGTEEPYLILKYEPEPSLKFAHDI